MKFSNLLDIKRLQNKTVAAATTAVAITVISAILMVTGIFDTWHLKIADTLYTRNEPSKDIVIIAIDDKSTDPLTLGRFTAWSRENYAKLLDVLQSENPKAIVFDIFFMNPTKGIPAEDLYSISKSINATQTPKEKLNLYENLITPYSNLFNHPIDKLFSNALQNFNNIVLATNISEENGGSRTAIHQLFLKNNPAIGGATITLDPDGISRKTKPTYFLKSENKTYDDLGLAAAKIFKNLPVEDQTLQNSLPLENGQMNVNFFGDPNAYQMVSFADVLNQKFTPNTFKDKIVLIGVTSFKEINDRVLTPRSNIIPMSGIEFRADEIQTIIEGKFLKNQSKLMALFVILLLSFGLAVVFNYLGVALSVGIFFATVIVYYIVASVLYFKGYIPNMFYPELAILFTFIASSFYKYFVTDKKKREIKSAFGHYVSEELVDEISKNPDMVHLGGEKKTITILFSDLKNSTAISEKTEITSWVSQVNEYFTIMESVIKHFNGTIDKYEGDAIMAFWNAPVSQPDHIQKAYSAAIEMKKYLAKLNENWARQNKPTLEMRIGINTGEAIVGNFGSQNRFDYTAMGDTINTASRLESCASKTYGGGIIISSGAADLAKVEQTFVIREIDTVLLPGKTEPITLYELICLKSEETDVIKQWLIDYAQALASYRQKDFDNAENLFAKIATTDKVAEVMLTRIRKIKSGKFPKQLDQKTMVFKILNK